MVFGNCFTVFGTSLPPSVPQSSSILVEERKDTSFPACLIFGGDISLVVILVTTNLGIRSTGGLAFFTELFNPFSYEGGSILCDEGW